VQRFYQNDGFNFATLIALGSSYRGLADVGEVLATIERIHDGDREAWVREWSTTADRLRSAAERSAKAERRVSARTAYLRASLYYDLASSMAPGTSDPSRFDSMWEMHRDCWDRAVALWPGVEPIGVPYEGTTLEAYWFSPQTAGGELRPTVILNNGSDGPVLAMWTQGGAAAVDRGWNAITFDGPGQGAALHRAHLTFRHDWEAVISPVVDYLLQRSDVDPRRIALHGISQAGYWVPRAAAFEHRLAAAVADPGVIDVSSSWLSHLPREAVEMLDDPKQKDDFDALMKAGAPPDVYAELQWRMAPYGTDSPFEAYQQARAMHLDDDTIANIQCPMLVTDPDDEQFWPGQSRGLFDKLQGPKELVRFTRAEGANWHCEVAAQSLRDERVFDWLEETFERVKS
jgi:Prolyl oligopeptidase family